MKRGQQAGTRQDWRGQDKRGEEKKGERKTPRHTLQQRCQCSGEGADYDDLTTINVKNIIKHQIGIHKSTEGGKPFEQEDAHLPRNGPVQLVSVPWARIQSSQLGRQGKPQADAPSNSTRINTRCSFYNIPSISTCTAAKC